MYDHETPEEFLTRIQIEDNVALESLNSQLPDWVRELKSGKRSVFFCVGSGFEWEPLHRFSHHCDTFVFVEPRATREQFDLAWQTINLRHTVVRDRLEMSRGADMLDYDAFEAAMQSGPLGEMQNLAGANINDPPTQRRSWGILRALVRRVGNEERLLWLVFLGGSPVDAYKQLFVANRTAPVMLSIAVSSFRTAEDAIYLAAPPNPHGEEPVQPQDWDHLLADLVGHQGPIAQLIAAEPQSRPRFLVGGGQARCFWVTVSNRYVYFTLSTPAQLRCVDTLTREPWPELRAAPAAAGYPRISVTRTPMNPGLVRDAQLVVLRLHTFLQYQWSPEQVVVITGPLTHAEERLQVQGTEVLDLLNKPLLEALKTISDFCASRGFSKVAIDGPLGFEDEALDMAIWSTQANVIAELSMHFNRDGPYLDYAPYAHAID